MTEILLTVALTQYPLVWANDYCVYYGMGNSPEVAERLATEATGAPTERAWELTKEQIWCQE